MTLYEPERQEGEVVTRHRSRDLIREEPARTFAYATLERHVSLSLRREIRIPRAPGGLPPAPSAATQRPTFRNKQDQEVRVWPRSVNRAPLRDWQKEPDLGKAPLVQGYTEKPRGRLGATSWMKRGRVRVSMETERGAGYPSPWKRSRGGVPLVSGMKSLPGTASAGSPCPAPPRESQPQPLQLLLLPPRLPATAAAAASPLPSGTMIAPTCP